MKKLTYSHYPACLAHYRGDVAIRPNRSDRISRSGSAKCRHALSTLVLAAALLIFYGIGTHAQEPGGPVMQPAAGGSAHSYPRQQIGGGVGGMGGGGMAQTGVFADRLQSIVSRAAPGPNSPKALVVLSSGPNAKVQANLQEDLAVMSHILDKAMDANLGSDQRLPNAMGVDLFFWPDAGSLRRAYLEGYGALFLLKVNFPLLPPPAKGEAQKEEPKGSSAWEEAREEVFGEPSLVGMSPGAAYDPYKVAFNPYSEEKVNRLKSSLLDALKNAANIRDLKADEGVTVCVFGGTKFQSGGVKMMGKTTGNRPGEVAFTGGPAEGAMQRGTILSLRVKKSAIDAFAEGKLNLDEFQKKAIIAVYEGDVGSGGPVGYGFGGVGGFGGGYGSSAR